MSELSGATLGIVRVLLGGPRVTDKERAKSAARRLAIIRHAREVSGTVSQTCRYYGIARQSYYVWLRRYEEKGLPGLEDRSTRPHRSPRATSTEIVGKIVHLRQTYHFGPRKIAMYPLIFRVRSGAIASQNCGLWRADRPVRASDSGPDSPADPGPGPREDPRKRDGGL